VPIRYPVAHPFSLELLGGGVINELFVGWSVNLGRAHGFLFVAGLEILKNYRIWKLWYL